MGSCLCGFATVARGQTLLIEVRPDPRGEVPPIPLAARAQAAIPVAGQEPPRVADLLSPRWKSPPAHLLRPPLKAGGEPAQDIPDTSHGRVVNRGRCLVVRPNPSRIWAFACTRCSARAPLSWAACRGPCLAAREYVILSISGS